MTDAAHSRSSKNADICIAGGGPAGMMAGLLFARAGLKTIVLEKHGDFLRDFRGDTVHPSTLEIIHELGLLGAFLARPHDRLERVGARFSGRHYDIADFSTLATHCKFIALMPQWDFLDFLAGQAARLPNFTLKMETEALGLLSENGVVKGVAARSGPTPLDIRARLTIGADGRHSRLRDAAGLQTIDVGAPIDVLWFRVPRDPTAASDTLFNARAGRILVTIDRGDYWQCGYVIEKDAGAILRERGINAFKRDVAATIPEFADALGGLRSFDDVKLLTVRIDRLERWSRAGLVMIGDAAHAMSPVGGVGINLAVQDAVAAANLFAGPLLAGGLSADDLDALRRRRLLAVRATQFVQVVAQNRLLAPILKSARSTRAPFPIRLVSRFRPLQALTARMIGIGARPEHVRSPEAP